MPVTLQTVDQARWDACEQERVDLLRIYADAPEERMRVDSPETFILQHLEARHFFACARFNDRLLGAVAIEVAADGAWWLSQLCVHKSTRRRGVGSRLIALMGELASEQGRVLRIATAALPLPDRILLSKLGYRPVSLPPPGDATAARHGEFVELNPQGKGE